MWLSTHAERARVGGGDANWQEVRRRNRNGEGQGRFTKSSVKVITSFFVSNLPSHTTKEKLRKAFKDFGEIHDVYIPARVDKSGSPFGFVKFINVRDKGSLAAKLSGIKMDFLKLCVNLERFDRKGMPINGNGPVANQRPPMTRANLSGSGSGSAAAVKGIDDRSFAKVAGFPSSIAPQEWVIPISTSQSETLDR
ncbi:hypothetical protein SSX86_019549 [Deinandra increscens subsp. villosa]|uniref:RRM domain-containing protein n=1 Tax=Deinandra increscens subsp. villosa TaxID=3103831 RepID=A0AAP0D018_9ASTR